MLTLIWQFINTAIGKIIIGIIALCLVFYSVYSNGYSNGIEEQKNIDRIAYNKALTKALSDIAEKQKIENEKSVKFEKSQENLKIVYINRVKKVKGIVETSAEINSPLCKPMSKEAKEDINKQLEEPINE